VRGDEDNRDLGISVDGAWCHIAFAHERKLRFPLLSALDDSHMVG
jgi:peroxiredoxin